jgi:bacitracin transport system permease protein
MLKLLWAECQKLRRSKIVWLTLFATAMVAAIVFIQGWVMHDGIRDIDSPGWYMTMAQVMATFMVLPGVIALLGSYIICREEQEDIIKSLRIIPINEAKLIAAKMMITLGFSVSIYIVLFFIAFLAECVLHFSELSLGMVLYFLKLYFLQGIGIYFAISPIIALVSYMKKGYWMALIFTEIYSFAGLFMSMSNTLKTFYPITASFGLAGYYETTTGDKLGSLIVLLLCGSLAAFILQRLQYIERN